MRLDAKLEPPLPDRYVVMGGVRLTDPLEQQMLDESRIEQLSARLTDRIAERAGQIADLRFQTLSECRSQISDSIVDFMNLRSNL
jgi:hypothetical protein